MPSADEDRIFAWATPPGRSAIAILRLSGTNIADIFEALTHRPRPAPRHATLCKLYHPNDNELIDEALCLYFPAPHSVTGEDVIEIHTHGSRAVIQELTNVLSDYDRCRLAEAGEFTRRAFANSKMNLYEVEGLADIIHADTVTQKRQALRQFSGEYSQILDRWRMHIMEIMALIEAYIDFPDEEIPTSVLEESRQKTDHLVSEIDDHLGDQGIGEKIRDGLTAVIFGPPNAGKSSLLNALAKRDVAIVSDIAGTTRDLIELHLDIDGYPVTLIDTAGIRDSEESIEQEGIRRAKEKLEMADIKIAIFDIISFPESYSNFKAKIDDHTLVLLNKTDQLSSSDLPSDIPKNALTISIHTGDGIDTMIDHVKKKIAANFAGSEPSIVTQKRHRIALENCLTHLSAASQVTALELIAEELRRAATEIGKITGRIEVDALLDIVFGRFCIGK